MPLVDSLAAALEHDLEVVVDLSDEPVLAARPASLASRALALGLPYIGADFRFPDPPALEPFELPSIGIVGTGKRVGKTAVGAHAARVLAERYDVVVVDMGRGGPAEPEVAETPPTIDDLLALSRSGRHAASDFLEDAALAGSSRSAAVERVGLVGALFVSTSTRGPRSRPSARLDFVIFEWQRRSVSADRHEQARARRRRRPVARGCGGLPERVPQLFRIWCS